MSNKVIVQSIVPMQFNFFCPRWGNEQVSWDEFIGKAKDAGYDGIEYAIANSTGSKELDLVWDTAAKYNMPIIAQHYETNEADFFEHSDVFSNWFDKIKDYRPVKINSQTGKDFFSFKQNQALIDMAEEFAKRTGITVVHETHRGKFSFTAHITKEYLTKIPSMRIALDVSHWICVSESFLEDQPEAMKLAVERTEHIHARVGYPEGPQVPDPRAGEWDDAVNRHIALWDKVVEHKIREDDQSVVTITPEFGPVPYMVAMPYTQQPLANQWDVNVFMMELLRKRYARLNIFKKV